MALPLAALALAWPAGVRAQFSARPVIVHFSPGGPGMQVVTVKNDGEEPMQLRLYPADFEQRVDGGHEFLEPGEHERSCAHRLSVFPDEMVLGPGESMDARVEMAPGDVTCWSLLFVERVQTAEGGIRIGQRIGVKVYGLGRGDRREGEVRSVTAEGGVDSVSVSFMVANTGDVPLRPEGEVELRTLAGDVVARRQVVPFSVLPGHTRRVELGWPPSLAPGRYLAVPLLDIGAEYLIGGQVAFERPAGSREDGGGSREGS